MQHNLKTPETVNKKKVQEKTAEPAIQEEVKEQEKVVDAKPLDKAKVEPAVPLPSVPDLDHPKMQKVIENGFDLPIPDSHKLEIHEMAEKIRDLKPEEAELDVQEAPKVLPKTKVILKKPAGNVLQRRGTTVETQ